MNNPYSVEHDPFTDHYNAKASQIPYKSREAYERHIKREILKRRLIPIKAQYDSAGNCTICGEAGRCPGWHTGEGKDNLISSNS